MVGIRKRKYPQIKFTDAEIYAIRAGKYVECIFCHYPLNTEGHYFCSIPSDKYPGRSENWVRCKNVEVEDDE